MTPKRPARTESVRDAWDQLPPLRIWWQLDNKINTILRPPPQFWVVCCHDYLPTRVLTLEFDSMPTIEMSIKQLAKNETLAERNQRFWTNRFWPLNEHFASEVGEHAHCGVAKLHIGN